MAEKGKIAIYPGSFDPITNGHLDIINRSSKLFDELIVAVSSDNSKETLFSINQRKNMIEQSVSNINNIKIRSFKGLLLDFAYSENIKTVVRGLRALSDFEYEFRMAMMNRNLNSEIETIFLMADSKYAHVSSSLVKEVYFLKGDVKQFVPKIVLDFLNQLKNEKDS